MGASKNRCDWPGAQPLEFGFLFGRLIELPDRALLSAHVFVGAIRPISDGSSFVLRDLARSSMTAHRMWLGLVEFVGITHSMLLIIGERFAVSVEIGSMTRACSWVALCSSTARDWQACATLSRIAPRGVAPASLLVDRR